MSLGEYLANQKFRRVPLSRTGVGHLEVAGTLNGRDIRILIDTGAASTVASLTRVREWGLQVEPLARCGAGAGGGNLPVFRVVGAELRLGGVVPKLETLLALDLTHVNAALAQKNVAPVDVVLGVDVFDIESGRIAEMWVTWDNLAALAQLGHLPTPSTNSR